MKDQDAYEAAVEAISSHILPLTTEIIADAAEHGIADSWLAANWADRNMTAFAAAGLDTIEWSELIDETLFAIIKTAISEARHHRLERGR